MERYELADGRVYLLMKIIRENNHPEYYVCGIIETPFGDTMWIEHKGSYSGCRKYIDKQRNITVTPEMLAKEHYIHKGAKCK